MIDFLLALPLWMQVYGVVSIMGIIVFGFALWHADDAPEGWD